MGNLYVTSGVPCSGKTTFVKRDFFNSEDIWYISRDKIRFSLLKDGEDYFKYENRVFEDFTCEISNKLKAGFNVIADATHLTLRSRRKLFNYISYHYANKIVGINIFPPEKGIEELIRRNNSRTGREKLPQEALEQMYKNYQPISINERPFSEVWDVRTR